MSENELNQSESDGGTSEQPAGGDTQDLEKAVREILTGLLDTRFSGFQSMIDRKLGTLRQELQTVGLTQEQQEELLEKEQTSSQERALQIAELIKRRKAAPEAVDFFIEVMDKPSVDDQIEFIQSVLGPKAAKQVTDAIQSATPESGGATSPEVPDVDKNNPAAPRKNEPVGLSEGMTEELADKILDQIPARTFSSFFKR